MADDDSSTTHAIRALLESQKAKLRKGIADLDEIKNDIPEESRRKLEEIRANLEAALREDEAFSVVR